jgi:hypothetical protein
MSDMIGTTSFPKSLHDHQCLGPCYEANTKIMHPVTFQFVTDIEHPFCPVTPWKDRFGKTWITDKCPIATHKLEEDVLLSSFFVTPKVEFNSSQFLKMYYSISSFEDIVLWYNDNTGVPYNTIRRILDAGWKAYGLEYKDKEPSELILDFLIIFIKLFWMPSFYQKLSPYMKVDNEGKIKVSENKTEKNSENKYEQKDKKMDFLIYLIDREFLKKTLQAYIDRYQDKWNEVPSHMKKIRAFLYNQIKNELGLTE